MDLLIFCRLPCWWVREPVYDALDESVNTSFLRQLSLSKIREIRCVCTDVDCLHEQSLPAASFDGEGCYG